MRLTFFVAAAAMLSATLAARADTVYSYTGLDYTFVEGSYTTNEHVTGTFTLANPIGANQMYAVVTPISFSFSDGVQTITSSTAFASTFQAINTDADGNITQADIILEQLAGVGGGALAFIDVLDGAVGNFNDAYVPFFSEGSVNAGGTFTTLPASVTPEPSSFALLGTGLLGVAGVMRKRFA